MVFFIHDILLSIDHGIHRFPARCIEFTIWPRNPSSSPNSRGSGVNYPAASMRPTKLHAISMTTAREPVRQFVTSLSALHIEGESGYEGGRAVRQYFLSSHGQLADRLVRPLLAQHTTTRSAKPSYASRASPLCARGVYVRGASP